MVLYHPLEHAAFFHDAGVLKLLDESNVARLWRLACSVWLAYVICDMPTNFLQLQQVTFRAVIAFAAGSRLISFVLLSRSFADS